ncbi:MAG: nucleotidyltransferase domain-containing protein [archaeon]
MNFRIDKVHLSNSFSENDIHIATSFAKEIKKEMHQLIKEVILFGSTARRKEHHGDIDVLVIIDDVSLNFTEELVQTYRIILYKIVSKISKHLHVTSMKLTSFWEYVRAGDPVAINILRDGVALIDVGFFDPLKLLLLQGRIRPSKEAIFSYYSRAPITLTNSKWHILQATLDLYWAVIDSAHAALMTIGEVPASPAHVHDLLNEKLVRAGLLQKKYAFVMKNFYDLSKAITHNEITDISGEQYEHYLAEAKDFVSRMEEFVKK